MKKKSSGGKNEPVSAKGVTDLLSLAGHLVPIRVTTTWDQVTRKEVANWAYGKYLGRIVKAPNVPEVLNKYLYANK